MLGQEITFGSKAEPALRDALNSQNELLQNVIDSQDIKGRINEAWLKVQEANRISNDPPVWLQITPQAAYFPGIITDKDSLKVPIALQVQTTASLQAEKPENPAVPLGQLLTEEPDIPSNSFGIYFPIVVDLDEGCTSLSDALRDKGQFSPLQDSPDVKVSIENLSCYQSGKDLGMRIELTIDDPDSWFDSSGNVFVRLTPDYKPETQTVSVTDYKVAGQTSNALSNLAIRIANSDIVKDAIVAELTYSVEDDLEEARLQANTALADLEVEEADIVAEMTSARVGNFGLSEGDLILILEIDGTLSVSPVLSNEE